MPKVELAFDIRERITQTVTLPQVVIDRYHQECAKDDPDTEALDRLLEPYIEYGNILDHIEGAEDIELSER